MTSDSPAEIIPPAVWAVPSAAKKLWGAKRSPSVLFPANPDQMNQYLGCEVISERFSSIRSWSPGVMSIRWSGKERGGAETWQLGIWTQVSESGSGGSFWQELTHGELEHTGTMAATTNRLVYNDLLKAKNICSYSASTLYWRTVSIYFYLEVNYSSLQTHTRWNLTTRNLHSLSCSLTKSKSAKRRHWYSHFISVTTAGVECSATLHDSSSSCCFWTRSSSLFSVVSVFCFYSTYCSFFTSSCSQSLFFIWEFLLIDPFLQTSSALMSCFFPSRLVLFCFLLLCLG